MIGPRPSQPQTIETVAPKIPNSLLADYHENRDPLPVHQTAREGDASSSRNVPAGFCTRKNCPIPSIHRISNIANMVIARVVTAMIASAMSIQNISASTPQTEESKLCARTEKSFFCYNINLPQSRSAGLSLRNVM